MNPGEHRAAALEFLELTGHSIAVQNRLLLSELLWCAAVHSLKSVAKQRGWRNNSHDDLFEVTGRLARELNDHSLRRRSRTASRLRRNMHEGGMSDAALARCRRRVRQLVFQLMIRE